MEEGHLVTLVKVECIIVGLRVKRVGATTLEIVKQCVDEIITLPDSDIFDAVVWLMAYCKVVAEGAAASTVGALLNGLIDAPPGTRVACVLSGGNLDLSKLKGMSWN